MSARRVIGSIARADNERTPSPLLVLTRAAPDSVHTDIGGKTKCVTEKAHTLRCGSRNAMAKFLPGKIRIIVGAYLLFVLRKRSTFIEHLNK